MIRRSACFFVTVERLFCNSYSSCFKPVRLMSTSQGFPRVLSIQSHIVHGFVGNKAAAFPLQTMGFDIDCINTVTLSNHPAYANRCRGAGLETSLLQELLRGLEDNGLLRYDLLLSGYTRQKEHLLAIADAVEHIRASANPDLLYICDPVLGDNGSYYVPEELRDIYLSRILPLATAVTPNVFETQVLCGAAQPPTTTEQALDACRTLHARGPEIVVLTGIPIANAETSPVGDAAAPTLSAVVSFRPRGADAAHEEVYQVELPRLPGALSGCGDLFAALLTPGIFRTMQMCSSAERGACLAACVAQAARTMTQVVADTLRHGEVELRILAARDAFIRHSDVVRDTVANYLLRHAPRDEHYASARAAHGVHDELLQLVQRVSVRRLRHRQAAGDPAASLASFHVSRHTSLPTAPIGALPLQPLGVIFDMDGTLTLPGAIDFAAMRRELTAMHPPLPPHSTMDLVAYLNGLVDSAEQTALYDVVRRYELAACDAQALRPHLHELLLLLRRHCHIPLALSTRNCREATDIFLYQRYDLPSDVFDFVQVRNTVAVDGQWVNKPHPSVAEDVLRRWQTMPAAGADGGYDEAESRRRVVFVGDSMDDMKCGRGAGCTTVLIRTHENEHYLRSADCVAHIDFVVSDLNDLALLLLGRPLHAH